MSDLQDIIAANAVKAYNQGFERGESSERERIAELVKGWQTLLCKCDPCKTARSIHEAITTEKA